MSRVGLALPLTALLAWGCGHDPDPVPFGLDRGATPPPGTTAPAPEPAPPSVRFAAAEWPAGTTEARVDGLTLRLPGATLRATATLDLDTDGDDDALALARLDDGSLALVAAARETAGLTAPRTLATHPVLPGCEPASMRFESLSDELVAAHAELRCANANDAPRRVEAWVVTREAAPRVLEHFGLEGGDDETLRFLAEDRDSDGHGDLVVQLGHDAHAASIFFRNAPAGLARDAAEPEATMAHLADEARSAVRREPDAALAGADRALGLWTALCRESDAARLRVGDARGVPCGRSAAAGRARAVLAAVHARAGRVLDALDAFAGLDHPALTVREADRTLATNALAAMSAVATSEVHEGPTVPDAGAVEPGAVRLSRLAFPDEGHLLLRGPGARVVDLEAGTEVPAPDAEDLRVLDPSRALALVGLERRCDGTSLIVAQATGFDPLGESRRAVLLEPRPAPLGAPCPDLTPALRADAHGFVALGWAPQGILVARHDRVLLAPLDVSGAALAPAAELAPDAPAPAPIAPGHATADASAFAFATTFGVVVVRRADGHAALVRPEGFTFEGTPSDVALSPSARRVAWISGGHARWIERAD